MCHDKPICDRDLNVSSAETIRMITIDDWTSRRCARTVNFMQPSNSTVNATSPGVACLGTIAAARIRVDGHRDCAITARDRV